MCFSATASFSAGTLLLGLGALTLESAHRTRERPFAAIPLLFAIQQLTEGVLWLTFRYEAPLLNAVMTYVYLTKRPGDLHRRPHHRAVVPQRHGDVRAGGV